MHAARAQVPFRGHRAALLALLLGLTACGGVDPPPSTAPTTADPSAPSGDTGPGALEPVWVFDDVAGAIQAIDAADGQMFVASSLPSGYLLWRGDLESGGTDWLLEDVTPAIERVAADGQGGVVTVSGNQLRAYDDEGEERWTNAPLRAGEGVASAGIDSIAVRDDAVLVGGDVYGAAAEVSLADGSVRWFLQQDRTATEDAGFLGAGEFVGFLDEDVAILSGGLAAHYTVVAVDRASGEVIWTRFSPVTPRALLVDDELLVLRTSETTLAALDPVTGEDRWVVEEPAWEDDGLRGPARVAGDVVIVSTIDEVTGLDRATGDEVWSSGDRDAQVFNSLATPFDDRVVGFAAEPTILALQSPDGSVRTGRFWDDGPVGTVDLIAVDGDRALVAAGRSTNQQPSTLWLLDLTDLA
jgi:outer membrane protein assembly factor BamB